MNREMSYMQKSEVGLKTDPFGWLALLRLASLPEYEEKRRRKRRKKQIWYTLQTFMKIEYVGQMWWHVSFKLNCIHVLYKNFKSSMIAHTLELQNEEDEAGESCFLGQPGQNSDIFSELYSLLNIKGSLLNYYCSLASFWMQSLVYFLIWLSCVKIVQISPCS